MPLYEYLCQNCSREVELLIQGNQEPTCPACGGNRLTKLLSVVASPGRDGVPSVPAGGGSCGAQCACHPHGS